MNPYQSFVFELAQRLEDGKGYPLGGFAPLARPALQPDAPKVLIFSPHPDDECVVGGLPLRLLREPQMRVLNVAVTQGSRKDRQSGRLAELKACCGFLGFDVLQTADHGLEGINPKTRAANQAHWTAGVDRITEILNEHRPRLILFPHEADQNSTHIGTYWLLMDALAKTPPAFQCYIVETEFWGAMTTPNLMVESSPADVADLVTALTFHVGEVQRNPYHLRLPAWMIDNVRRGCEIVGAQGGAAPDFQFATLYRLRRWREGGLRSVLPAGRFIARSDDVGALFPA